jgi:N-acetylglucosamine kinase-like BadF-type ATPase
VLTRLVPELFGLATVHEVTEGLHFGRIPHRRIAELSPLLFAAARAGEPLALADVAHQAEEILILATTALRRLDLLDAAVPVVLGGGVLAAGDPLLLDRIRMGLAERAPRARLELVTAPPIVGAVALVLRASGAEGGVVARARSAVERALQPVGATG